MPELIPVSWLTLVKKFRTLGFEGPFQGGKHPYMIRKNTVLTIPNQHNKELSVALLSRILKQAGISKEDWLLNK